MNILKNVGIIEDKRKLYKLVHDQVLDYADEEIIYRCATWGYRVEQKLAGHGRFIVQAGAESASSFMCAVVTAVIIGEFAKHAFNDYFSGETGIDLDLLDVEFGQIRGFLEKDIPSHRLIFLEEGNSVGLQDMWDSIYEWKSDTYRSLVYICKQQGIEDPNDTIFYSLIDIFKSVGNTNYVSLTDTHRLAAYAYVTSGFQ